MMIDLFITDLKATYNEITLGNKEAITLFKAKWSITGSIGEAYQNICEKELKKDMGSFYTPVEIVDYMVSEALEGLNYENNKFIRILDPSCGGGYFLLEAFKYLREKYRDRIDDLDNHLLKYNIFGSDTDENAIMICKIEFYELTGTIPDNLVVKDFLLDYDELEFDIIIGNPPYMGHKLLVGDYRERLYTAYGDVFYDKGDMSYCFIKKSIDLLHKGGRLLFFTSRYILEALNGKGIRNYLAEKGLVNSLVDFYGVRVVKGAGVDNIILNFIREDDGSVVEVYRLKENARGAGREVFEDIKRGSHVYVKYFKEASKNLDNRGWILLTDSERAILSKLKGTALNNICESYQGIISGCDKAFVVSRETAAKENIEEDILKPWIKNSNVNSFFVSEAEELIIYLNSIKDEGKYDEALKHVGKYYDTLMNRRECRTGRKTWYHLQWGREEELFEGTKIIYPYKASSSRFAIDKGNYFSADIYALRIYSLFQDTYTYEYLEGLLNSSLYEFYIKSMAKKLGDNLYEYYPNKIMTLRIPDYIEEIDRLVRAGGENLREKIDLVLNEGLGITSEEYGIIKEWCR